MRMTPNRPTAAPAPTLAAWEVALLCVLLAIFLLLTTLASRQKSASFDEQYHLTAGYSYLRTGDFRLATTHPPLMGMLAALPLLAVEGIQLPLEDDTWQAGNRFEFSDVFLWRANDHPQQLLEVGRVSITLLGALLVFALFRWARRMIGPGAAWVVLLLAVFDPNLLANSRLITTDLGLTALLCLTLWRLWCWLETNRRADLLLAGVLAGLTMAAKYTGLMIWPIIVIVLVLQPRAPASTWRQVALQRSRGLLTMALLAVITLWAVYRFYVGVAPALPIQVPLPAPAYWHNLWQTFSGIVQETGVKPDFLLGEASTGGWWYYFPVALGVKTPLPLLISLAAAVAVLTHHGVWRRHVVLWAPTAVFLLLGLSGILTIGYRHMLPVIPFAILLAGYASAWAWSAGRWPRLALVALLTWLTVSTLWFFPNHESYFNELAGGWRNWSNILVDSNLDWGQDLPSLRRTMDDLQIDTVNLAYFGKAAPEAYGVHYRPLPGYLRFMGGRELNAFNPYTPEPGWYAISATSLRLGTLQPDTVDLYAFFRGLTPVARAGYSIALYKVTYPDGTPVTPSVVVGDAVARRTAAELGLQPGGRVAARWTQSPATEVYPLGHGWVAPSTASYRAVDANYSGVFTLIGVDAAVEAVAAGQALPVTLYWRVGDQPMPMPAPTRGEPVAAFIHLVAGDPANKVAQFDGWDAALAGLEPGDIMAQHVDLDVGADVQPGVYDLLVGLYSPQNWERVIVKTNAETQEFVAVGEIRVGQP